METSEMYAEDGSKYIIMATVAVYRNNTLLIGTLHTKALTCQIIYME